MNLYNYQKNAVSFILETKKCALYLDMGLGKTVISLTALQKLSDEFRINKTLVIAPLRVANDVWHNEIKAWGHLTHLKYSIVTGNEEQRLEALKHQADVYIINRENILWLFMNGYREFDMIIVDESTSFKNPSRKGAKIFQDEDAYNKYKPNFLKFSFDKFKKLKINKFVALSLMKYEYMVQLSGTLPPMD